MAPLKILMCIGFYAWYNKAPVIILTDLHPCFWLHLPVLLVAPACTCFWLHLPVPDISTFFMFVFNGRSFWLKILYFYFLMIFNLFACHLFSSDCLVLIYFDFDSSPWKWTLPSFIFFLYLIWWSSVCFLLLVWIDWKFVWFCFFYDLYTKNI